MDVTRVFVGRERELSELEAALEQAFGGRGSLFLIGGEPGVGKTRLADRFSAAASTRGARALWGRCWESGGAPVYWPWGEMLRILTRIHDDEALLLQLGTDAPWIAGLVPELQRRFPRIRVPSSLESDSSRFALLEGTVRFLKNVAADRPLVLVLDDLHAADASTLLVLRFLARELREARILVLGTYRDSGVRPSPTVTDLLAGVLREGRLLSLRGFTLEESSRFVRSGIGGSANQTLLERVQDATGGNPLFLQEIIRLLLARGEDFDLLGRSAGIDPVPIPTAIRETFHGRLASLSTPCRDVLAVASAFGNEFEISALSEVCGSGIERLLELLGEALADGIVSEVSSSLGRFSFVHGMVRDTLYQSLTYGRRLEIHRAIGRALERLYAANPDPHLSEVALHYWRCASAGERDKAADYAFRAGRQAASVLAHDEAAIHYQRALELLELETTDEHRHADVALRLGDALGRAGAADDSRQMFRRATDIFRRLGDVEGFARAALGFAGGGFGGTWAIVHSESEPLGSLLEEALEQLPVGHDVLRAKVLARLATALHYAPSADRRESLSCEAVAIARHVGDRGTLAFTLGARHYALCGPEHIGERLGIADEIIRLAEGAGDRELDLQGRAFRIADLVEMGELMRAGREIEIYSTLADTLREPFYLWYAAVWKGMCATTQGRFEEGARLAREALAIGRQAQEDNAVHTFGAQMVPLRWLRGEIEEAIADVQRLVCDYPAFAGWRFTLAMLYAEAGRTEEARRELGPVSRDDSHMIHGGFRMLMTAFLAETCAVLDDREWAARLYRELGPFAVSGLVDGHDVVACFGSVSHPLGLLAATLGRRETALRHFEDAITMHERMGARPFLARSAYEAARILVASETSGDRERGLARARQALTIAEDLGMRRLAENSRRLGVQAVEVAAPADTEPSGSAARPPADSTSEAVFRREGRYWRIVWSGESVRLKDAVGLRYLAELLRHPGRMLRLSELAACVASSPEEASLPGRRSGDEEDTGPPGDAGELIDDRSRMAYRARLQELRGDLAEAERKGDADGALAIEREIETLTRELARAVGLGGRARRAGSETERLRIRVTKAIRSAIRKIGDANPSLGHHLATTVRTGAFCSYVPDPSNPPCWNV